MTEKPLVSIITPVFNGEKYIRRTIESIINQSYVNIEYIVVDGASIDSTLDILSEYQRHLNLVISEADSGMYHAINKGFAQSTGQILCYLNSDDYFFPDTVECIVDRFVRTNASLVFGNCIYVDSCERELFRYSGVNLDYFLAKRLGRIPFAQQTAFWSRSLYTEIGGFDQRYKYVADTKFLFECLRIASDSKSFINRDLAMFRLHSNAFSTKAHIEMALEHDLVLSDLGLKIGGSRYVVESIVKSLNFRNFIRRLI